MKVYGKRISVFVSLTRALLVVLFISHSFILFAESPLDKGTTSHPPADKPIDSSPDPAAFESSLIPSFIELQISSKEGDHFYEVLVDGNERPYLEINDVMQRFLKTDVSCQTAISYCEALINVKKRTYWIDGVQQKSSSLDNAKETMQLPANVLVKKEGKLWLRFDYWPQWLPVSSKWDLDNYHLDFFPMFPLLDELKQKRANLRKIAFTASKEQDRIQNLPAKEASSDYDTHFRYHLEHERYFNHTENINRLDFALNMDLWKGTLLATGSYTQQQTESEESSVSDGSWRYTRLENPYVHLYEMGHLNLVGSLLIPYASLDNAIHLKRLKKKEGIERMRFHGLIQPSTEIDLYYKSFLIDTVTTDSSGQFQFEDMLATGGEEVKLVYYYPDGSSKEESMYIASDDGSIIGYHEWDGELYYGSTETTRIAMLSGYYGLFENLTLGLHNTQYSLIDEDKNEENEDQTPNSNIPFFSLAWRLFYGLTIQAEHSSSEHGTDSALEANLSYFRPHTFSLLYRTLNRDGDLWDHYSEGDTKKESYLEMQYLVGIDGWLWRAIYKQWDEEENINLTLMYRINKNIAVFWNPISEKKPDEESAEHTVGANYTSTHHIARLASRFTEEGMEPSLSYRFSGKKTYPWDISVGASQSAEGKQTYHIRAEYRFTPQITTEIRNEHEETSASVAWHDILVLGQGPDLWEEFATGTLYGKVYSQKHPFLPPEPVEGAIVTAQSKKGVTDANGSYLITGLPAGDRIKVRVDPRSLDIDLIPEKDLEIVVFRPGTKIEHNLKIVRNVGIDGKINHSSFIPEGALIEAVKVKTGKTVAVTLVEADGFFIIEGLSPGDYLLRLVKVNNPPKPFELTIEEDLDWISDITIEWP
jgi:hypothetical protein